MLYNFNELKYYDSAFSELISYLTDFKTYISRSEYLKISKFAAKAERASARNMLTKQGKTVSEILFPVDREKQFEPITAEVKAF